jgi:hypothetical protein
MKNLSLFLLCALVLLAAAPVQAQFSYPNFGSVAGLVLNGSAAPGLPVAPEPSVVLRLMDGLGSCDPSRRCSHQNRVESDLVLASSRAKDGAISPRLANRYSRFALSHRSCGDGAHRVGNGNNVLKDHS